MASVFTVLLFLNGVYLEVKSDYVPGEAGAEWTKDELLIVKAKLYRIFSGGGFDAVEELNSLESGPPNPVTWSDVPDAAKMLRLGFHDCLRYTDGTGGCDGCLNWEGVGDRFPRLRKRLYPDINKTNNNGLWWTVEVLEALYTDPAYPSHTPVLDIGLKSSGKSRSDLWAYAAIVAVEYGIEMNNKACDGDRVYGSGGLKQCHQFRGDADCKILDLRTNPLQFKTGRRDCITTEDRSFKTSKEEHHPSPVTNGKGTLTFFNEDFNMNSSEVVALFGAHTLGRMHREISSFRYTWTSRGTGLFNNQYYRSITRKDAYLFNNDACTKRTDAWGSIPVTRWVTRARNDTHNGGPAHWIHQNYICSVNTGFLCPKDPNASACCPEQLKLASQGLVCRANRPSNEPYTADPNINGGCERFSIIEDVDEMALSAEIGLYFDFDVDGDGNPTGCSADSNLAANGNFKLSGWIKDDSNKGGDRWSQRFNANTNKWEKADPDCPIGDLADVFETYASNQTAWIQDFSLVLIKMLENGYKEDELKLAPDHFSVCKGACKRICKRKNTHTNEAKLRPDSNMPNLGVFPCQSCTPTTDYVCEDCFSPRTASPGNPISAKHGKKYFQDVVDSTECQKKCQENPECAYFHVLPTGNWKGCWLKTAEAKNTLRSHRDAIFGPKYCEDQLTESDSECHSLKGESTWECKEDQLCQDFDDPNSDSYLPIGTCSTEETWLSSWCSKADGTQQGTCGDGLLCQDNGRCTTEN